MSTVQRLLVTLLAATLLFFGGIQGAAQAAPTTPTTDFTDNQDGTVTHKTTGLTWKRCSEGQAWSGSTCTGTAAYYTRADAVALTQSYAGKNDWRLPTVRELSTIVEMDATNPAINGTIFPNTPASNFWSASSAAGNSDVTWLVYFGGGFDYNGDKASNAYVRLVRGGQSLGSLASSRPTTDYVDNGDGTVTHTPTALTWKRCAEGQTWNGGACSGTVAPYTWAAATALTSTFAGKSDWRVPTQTELRSLVDFTLTSPAINTTIFPNTPASYFWSASSYAGNSDYAWYVYFGNGYDNGYNKTNDFYVRRVRGGQSIGPSSPAVSLNGLSLSCPSTLAAGASGSCTATASYSDGTTKAVSPTWSSSNATVLYVGSGGSLAAGNPGTDTAVTISAAYTENGVTKTTTTIIVKAAVAVLKELSAACPATLDAGASAACSATASYSDGSSRVVNATWTSSNTSVATVSGLTVTASAGVTTDTPVSLNAIYSENGVTQTATAMVAVKAAVATLSNLELACPATMTASSTGNCSVMAVYSDGKRTAVTSGTWTVTPASVATIDATGMVTASKVTADTPITVNVSYTENGKTVTAAKTITIKVAACLANTGEITIAGAGFKKLGESLDVRYRLCNFNKATRFDVYVAVQLPDGEMLFLSSSGSFFGTPTFSLWDGKAKPAAYLSNTLVPDLEGSALSMSVMPLTLPTGTYTFYAIPVLKGGNVMNGFEWVGSLASGGVTLGR